MGSECRHIYKHNLGLTEEHGKDADAILDALETYFKPARNIIFERFVFGTCKQDEGEPIDSFITKLREKAASCEYGQLKEELIRDRLVLGVSDENVRRRLLRQKDLTLASAIEICRAAEMTDIRIQAITQDRSLETVHATDGPRSYLVDVEGTLYRRNRVHLRPAERVAEHRPEHQHNSSPTAEPRVAPSDAVENDVKKDS
ncbi:uncharacterized protein LOC109528957 [Hippocampus comes]|uniref:uncharacterized protein LOC109528957 n=1 Tax=Hippocampus comes TaxID=109280 RepID=UPI00094F0C35|nr:PREDICTED: uncharacterized protein LOC109528957 [Hippocampus comes]